jgi:hypothetical protein
MKDRVRLVRVLMDYATITLTTTTLTTIIRIVFITLITIGGVITYAILAPILITYLSSTISVGVGSIVATITSERIITPATLAPILITYTIPIIIGSVYGFTVLAHLDTI